MSTAPSLLVWFCTLLRGVAGGLIGIAAIGWLEALEPSDMVLLIGSFGASAVIVFATPASPTAQPRPLVGGNALGASVGIAVASWVPGEPWLLGAIAVAVAIGLMKATDTLHPPGGATALLAVIGSEKIRALGWLFLPTVLIGALILLTLALLVHNLPGPGRHPYPAPPEHKLR